MKVVNYIKNIFVGIWHLGQGMYVTMLNFCRPKVTQQYPENRGRREYGERFRALLTMPHDAENHHKCIACGMCMNNCPNGTIQVVARTETDPATGKPKRVLDKHLYNLGSCIFCGLCVSVCPTGAIRFTNEFEHEGAAAASAQSAGLFAGSETNTRSETGRSGTGRRGGIAGGPNGIKNGISHGRDS